MKKYVLSLFLAGCGGDSSGGGSPVGIDELGQELGVASCGLQFECCTGAEIMQQYMNITFDGQPITTEPQCIDYTNAFYTAFMTLPLKDSIALGRAEYDAAAAGDCVAALQAFTCDDYRSPRVALANSSCRPYIISKVGDGGPCLHDYECTSDNCFGETNSLDGTHIDGACAPMPAAGESCDDNCERGFYCGSTSGSGGETCQATKPDGASCTFDRECTSERCDHDTDLCASQTSICDGQ
jgi:hypothetical protein